MLGVDKNYNSEIHKIINDKDSISEFLLGKHDTCGLFNKELEIVNFLGAGVYGSTFLVRFKDGTKKRYVVKDIILDVTSTRNRVPLLNNITSLTKYLSANTINKYVIDLQREDFPIYTWENGYISEYVLAAKCSELTRKEVSPHFIEIGTFNLCDTIIDVKTKKPIKKRNNASLRFFMEEVDGIVYDKRKCFDDDILLIQGFSAIEAMHKIGINHNDFKLDNIGFTYIQEGDTWRGEPLTDADWFCYNLQGQKYYIPFTPYFIKVLDFGLSMMYDNDIVIGNETVYDGSIKSVPAEFFKSYDYAFFAGVVKEKYITHKNVKYDKHYNYRIRVEYDKGKMITKEMPMSNFLSLINPKYKIKPTTGKIVNIF